MKAVTVATKISSCFTFTVDDERNCLVKSYLK